MTVVASLAGVVIVGPDLDFMGAGPHPGRTRPRSPSSAGRTDVRIGHRQEIRHIEGNWTTFGSGCIWRVLLVSVIEERGSRGRGRDSRCWN